MNQFQIKIQPRGPFSSYFEDAGETLPEARQRLAEFIAAPGDNPGEMFCFDFGDVLTLVDPDGTTIDAFSRERVLLGYQVTDAAGAIIHGEDSDPFELTTFEILAGDAIDGVRGIMREHPSEYGMSPIFEGDIEDPSLVYFVSRKGCLTP